MTSIFSPRDLEMTLKLIVKVIIEDPLPSNYPQLNNWGFLANGLTFRVNVTPIFSPRNLEMTLKLIAKVMIEDPPLSNYPQFKN